MATSTWLQGSLVVLEDFTLQLSESSGTSNLSMVAGTEWDSLDDFLADWAAEINSDIAGQSYALAVVTTGAAKGKIQVTNAGHAVTINFYGSGGSVTEGQRWMVHLGEVANVSGAATAYTFTNAHKAGFYPSLSAQDVVRRSTGYGRAQRLALSGRIWTQHNTAPDDPGEVGVDVTLQLDGSTDWAELGELHQFVDDVLEYMGEPFTIYNQGPHQAPPGDTITGYFVDEVIDLPGERVSGAWNGLLTASFAVAARVAP